MSLALPPEVSGTPGDTDAVGSGESLPTSYAKLPGILTFSLFPAGFPSWLAAIRAVCFYLTTFAFAAPLFVAMLAAYPLVLMFDKYRRRAEHVINNIWAKLTTLFYYPVQIEGLENLPQGDQPAVYVSNHQSFLVSSAHYPLHAALHESTP